MTREHRPHARPLHIVALTLVAVALAHCARGSVSNDGGGHHDAGRTSDALGLVAEGAGVVQRYSCNTCHTSSDPADGILSGQTTPRPGTDAYGANITPDPDTGIGTWTDEQIIRAVRQGIDDQGEMLCVMPLFPQMTDAEANALVAYLHSLDPVNHAIPETTCPVPDGGVMDSGTTDDAGSGGTDAGMPDTFVRDAGTPPDVQGSTDAGPLDAGTPDVGFPDTGTPDMGTPDTGMGTCTGIFTINEVQVGGANGAGDEFVEIYNAANCDASLDGYFLAYSSATGTTYQIKWSGSPTDLVPANGFAIVGGVSYTAGPVIGRLSGSTGALSGTGGGLGLVDPAGYIVDSVGYGGTATNMFVEAAPAATPPAGSSIGRHPDGADSDDNSVDYTVGTSTPGAPN